MSVSLALAQALAAGVMRDLVGDAVSFSSTALALAVYPAAQSGGPNASQVIIRGGADMWIRACDNTTFDQNGAPLAAYQPAVSGPPSAQLSAGVEYLFVLSPNVNTLSFIHPTGTSASIKWIIGD